MKLHSKFPHAVVALTVLSLYTVAVFAQQPTKSDPSISAVSSVPQSNDDPQKPNPGLTVRSEEVLKSYEPAANEEYTLGAGDEISLDFPGRPELVSATKQVIGPDGRITLPLAGAVPVANLTRDQAQQAIIKAMSSFYTDLSVTVKIEKYSSNRVRVLGYVQHPGEIAFEETPTLLNAIGRAGLISPVIVKEGVTSAIGSGIPEICTVYRGNTVAFQVRLREMLMSGNLLADMRLRRNDIVYVPEPKQLFVSVLGQVSKPGTIPLTPDSTLTAVLAQAGCCSELGGFNPEIHIVQPSTGKDFKIRYNKIMTLAGQNEFTLHSGDVILVPESGFNKAAGVLTKVSPIATMVGFAAVAGVL